MIKMTPLQLYEFIDSGLNELEYFNCNECDTISLVSYLENLKKRQLNYNKKVNEVLYDIKDKNPWVYQIIPNYERLNSVLVKANNGSYFFVDINENKVFDIDHRMKLYKQKRMKNICDNSSDELVYINGIINNLELYKNTFSTVSENFIVSNSKYNKCDILCPNGSKIDINIETNKIKNSKRIMSFDECIKKDFDPVPLSPTDLKMIVKKLYLYK